MGLTYTLVGHPRVDNTIFTTNKAYIPLQRKIPGVGGWRWAMPSTPGFCIGNTNMLERTQPDAKPKICVLLDTKPKRKPVEYRLRLVPMQNSGVGHVHFMFFVLISFALGSQRKQKFQWNMGLTYTLVGHPQIDDTIFTTHNCR